MKLPGIPIIRTKEIYSKYFRAYGIPNACTNRPDKRLFGGNSLALFVDDDADGKPVAIAFKTKLLK